MVMLLIVNGGFETTRAESKGAGSYGRDHPTLYRLDQKVHDINAVYLMVSNQGIIGNNSETGNHAGFFPSNTSNNYVFGTGLWFGARYDIDHDDETDKVFTVGYNLMAIDSEFREGTNDQEPDDPLTRIFDSTDPDDLKEWPDRFRKNGLSHEDPYIISDQDLVTTYTTKDRPPIFGEQMPIEVNQRSLVFQGGLAGQAVIFIFDIVNWGTDVMFDSWIGYISDMDIGVSFNDDLASFIKDRITLDGDSISVNMGFAWDSYFSESNFVGHPGFVGIAYLQSPGNPSDGIDNDGDGLIDESPFNELDDDGDGLVDEPDEVDELGLVNYSEVCRLNVPAEVVDPSTDEEGFDILSCISESNPDSTSSVVCLESTTPADIRFMISSGPFDWQPGQTQQIVMAMVFANAVGNPSRLDFVGDPPRPDPNDPALSELLAVKETVQRVFDLNFPESGPPPAPNLTLIPGDDLVTLLWDDLPLRTPDPYYDDFEDLDPEYREYDFQGFRVWRSRTGTFSRRGDVTDPDFPLTPEAIQQNEQASGYDLKLLAQYDLEDGITTNSHGITCSDSLILLDSTVVYTDCDTFNLGTDTGLSFSYLDRGDPGAPLINGFRYYYSVTAYDYNSDALSISRLSTDSGVSFPHGNSVIPRSNASSYRDAFAALKHISTDGEVIDDTSSIFVSPLTGELDAPEVVHASNALTDFSFNSGFPEKVSDDYYTLVLDHFEQVDDITNNISYHMEDPSGASMNTSAASSFNLVYDGTDQAADITVFAPDDSTRVLFVSDLVFKVDSESFIHPQPATHFLATNPSEGSILDSLGVIVFPSANASHSGFRASDLRMEWVEGEPLGSLTLEVIDLDNLVEVPFEDGIVDSAYQVMVDEEGSNWSFLPVGAGIVQPGGRYLDTFTTSMVVDLWICGIRMTVAGMRRMPLAGDIWTLRQLAYTMEIDTTVTPNDTIYYDSQRPPVPGTRYRIDTAAGGIDKGTVDLTQIRVVPNPYIATSAFEQSPLQRQLQFINLPPECTIRIYTISGNLVRALEHTPDEGGTENYDLMTSDIDYRLASGNYYYHVTTPDGKTHLGRFAVVQ
jgi:hypothetical protein